jgi:uncharacterized protein YggL (DUF469 family)
MVERKWASDSFFEGFDQNRIVTVLTITEDDGKIIKQQLTVNKFANDGSLNPDYEELVAEISEEKITENTNKRNERKLKERELLEQERIEKETVKALQELFETKIQAFEIEAIKKSANRELKAKLRKAANKVEVYIYSMMIVMEELNNEKPKEDAAESE